MRQPLFVAGSSCVPAWPVPDLAHVALKVLPAAPGTVAACVGQQGQGWLMAGAFSSPRARLGLCGLMLLLLLCPDTVQGAKGCSW